MELLKVHGSENQFFILDQTKLQTSLTDEQLAELAQEITNPDNGVLGGADGVLVVNHANDSEALGQMRVFNADGSEASMCGNGLRTVARYLSDQHHQDEFKVETKQQSLNVKRVAPLANGVAAFSVEIAPIRYEAKDFPFQNLDHDKIINQPLPQINDHLNFTTIAVPNPHLISFVETEEDLNDTLGSIGKRLNGDNPYFTDGVNVNFAKIIGKNHLFVHTYERGVGFTNACGTGMSATSLAFAINYPEQVNLNEPVSVTNPGGMVKVKVGKDNAGYHLALIGNATFTNKIEVNEEDLHHHRVNGQNIKVTPTKEENDYQKFVQSLKETN